MKRCPDKVSIKKYFRLKFLFIYCQSNNRLPFNYNFCFLSFKYLRLDKLELLRLDHNKLNQLPCESFMEMLSLTSLNLNNNFLSKKPDVSQDCLKNSMELSELHLQANVLHEDNLEWMNLAQFKKLSKLDLSGNKFTKIPYHALAGIKSIKSLKITIDEREFTRPKATVMLWPNLTFLDLSGSSIRSIGNRSFEFISTNLTELILRNCQIHVIEPDAFAKLNSLILVRFLNYFFFNRKVVLF